MHLCLVGMGEGYWRTGDQIQRDLNAKQVQILKKLDINNKDIKLYL